MSLFQRILVVVRTLVKSDNHSIRTTSWTVCLICGIVACPLEGLVYHVANQIGVWPYRLHLIQLCQNIKKVVAVQSQKLCGKLCGTLMDGLYLKWHKREDLMCN